MPLPRSGAHQSDARVAQDGGTAVGHFARGSDGHPRGLRCYGSSDAQAVGGNEGGFGLGIGGGRSDEGDVEVGRQSRAQHVDGELKTNKGWKRNSNSKNLFDKDGSV